MKTPEEAMELIENMAASDHAILCDQTHIPIKRSLLELSSQNTLLAQNKLLAKQLKTLTETLGKLPTQLQVTQPSHSVVLQVGGCSICGGAHESSCCIPLEEAAQEVNYMGSGDLTLETNSIKTKVDYPTSLKIKGLAFMKEQPSWRRLWLCSCSLLCPITRAQSLP